MNNCHAEDQQKLSMKPELVVRPAKPSDKPVNQTIIMAGFMMMRSSRSSMTLKVSDGSEPFGIGVIDEQPRQIKQPRHPRDDRHDVKALSQR